MRGEKTAALLELISKGVGETVDLFEAFLTSGYGATPGRIRKELSRIEQRKDRLYSEKQARQNYYTLLTYLKKDGLIKQEISIGRKFFTATNRGKNKLALFKKGY